ncbi:1933_t:CDS:2, partial [Cetraspora pellucida]
GIYESFGDRSRWWLWRSKSFRDRAIVELSGKVMSTRCLEVVELRRDVLPRDCEQLCEDVLLVVDLDREVNLEAEFWFCFLFGRMAVAAF